MAGNDGIGFDSRLFPFSFQWALLQRYIVSTARRVPSLRSAPWPSIPLFRFSGLNWLHGSVKHVPQRNVVSLRNSVFTPPVQSPPPPPVLLPWGVVKTRLEIPQCLRPPTPLAFFPDVVGPVTRRRSRDETRSRQQLTRRDETRDGLVPSVSRPKITRRDEIETVSSRLVSPFFETRPSRYRP